MQISDLKRMEKPWADFGLELTPGKQTCPIHGGKTLEVKMGDHAILWKCWSPACPAHDKGGTIVDLMVATGQADSHGEALVLLLQRYGGMSEEEAMEAAGLSGQQRAVGKGGVETVRGNPRGAAPPPRPSHYLDHYERRRTSIKETYKIGTSGDVVEESYTLESATRCWVTSGVYAGRTWSIAVMRWDVTDPMGQPHKIIRSFTRRPEGAWLLGIHSIERRPLFNLLEIEREKDAPVIIVEGEKCMSSLSEHVDEMMLGGATSAVVTTSVGGAAGVSMTDWSALKGRRIIIVPDCDPAGMEYLNRVMAQLPEEQVEIVWVHADRDQGDGYDIHDWLVDNPSANFWQLSFEPGSWQSELAQLREACDRCKIDGAQDLLVRIMEKVRPGPLILEDFISRISKGTGLSRGAIKRFLEEWRTQDARRGWASFFAERVIEEDFEGHLLYEGEQWWYYVHNKWRRIPHEQSLIHVIHMCMMRHWPYEVESWVSTMKNTLEAMRAMCASMRDRLRLTEPPPALYNCDNLIVRVDESGKITTDKHRPDRYLTHSIQTRWDDGAPAPRYEEMLQTLFVGDADLIRHWHEIAGYLLQPDRHLKHFFIFQGGGNNGKTSLMRILTHLAKESTSYGTIGDLEQRFAMSRLLTKLLFVDDDVANGTRLPDGVLKKISENKDVDVEFKRKDVTSAALFVAPILLCNQFPSTNDINQGMIQRAIVLPFLATIPKEKRDPSLVPHIIRHELPGVLSMAIHGYARLRDRGHFLSPTAAVIAHDRWLSTANHVVDFARKYLVPKKDASVTAHQCYAHYQRYCIDQGTREGQRVSMAQLGRILAGLDHDIAETSPKYGSWRLRSFAPRDLDQEKD